MFQIIPYTMLSEPEIVSLLSFSALLLVFMMTFLKPEKEDQEGNNDKHEKKLRINPYLPFMSPTNYSPYMYVHTTHSIPKLHLDV